MIRPATALLESALPIRRWLESLMPIESVRCPVLGSHISRVTDLEGQVTRVICPEYEESTGGCRLKKESQSGGMLSNLLERVSESTLDTKDPGCVMR
jgi:hypothetical protein